MPWDCLASQDRELVHSTRMIYAESVERLRGAEVQLERVLRTFAGMRSEFFVIVEHLTGKNLIVATNNTHEILRTLVWGVGL